jgi:hypothetical protein
VRQLFRAGFAAASVLLSALPACAFDQRDIVKAVFGSGEPKDLGLPILAGLAVLAVFVLYVAVILGRRRQRREIEAYHAQLAAYSKALRRDMK